MRRSTSAAATPPAPTAPTSPKPAGATKRQRKAAPLGDVTNLLHPETPTPIKPRRTARRPVPAPSDASSTCSSSASVTPALNPSSSASATPAPKPSSSAPATPAPEPSSAAAAAATPAPQPSSSAAAVTPVPEPSSAAAAVTPVPEPSSAAAAVTPVPEPSSAVLVTPAPKPSSASVLDDVLESPTICTVYARRRTTEVVAEGRINPTIANKGKGKGPIGAAAASCPHLGKSTRNIRKKDTQPISSSAPCREAKKKRPLASTPELPEEFVKKQRAYFAEVDAFELVEEEVSDSELE